jgi:putative two-component system response regulator
MDKKKVVFLVDDDITLLTIGKGVLGGVYSVFTLNSGANMLKMLPKIRPDLILLDVNMPDMDGYEVISRLKNNPEFSQYADIPVIFLTSFSGNENEFKGLSLGAVDYITKPIDPACLLSRLEKALEVLS